MICLLAKKNCVQFSGSISFHVLLLFITHKSKIFDRHRYFNHFNSLLLWKCCANERKKTIAVPKYMTWKKRKKFYMLHATHLKNTRKKERKKNSKTLKANEEEKQVAFFLLFFVFCTNIRHIYYTNTWVTMSPDHISVAIIFLFIRLVHMHFVT